MPADLKSRLARIARVTAKIAAGLVSLLILIVVALLIVNSFDAAMTDQAKALLTAPQNTTSTDQKEVAPQI
jgi:archaellum component FlaG (FlaF/FlaG flagellin family)